MPLELAEWNEQAVREELVAERRKKLRAAQERRAAKDKFSLEVADWREQVRGGGYERKRERDCV